VSNSLFQTETWTDGNGEVHLISEMSLSHKLNVVAYIERAAPRIMETAYLRAAGNPDHLGEPEEILQCVVAEIDGEPIECGATHLWSHGVWHGRGPVPGSEADDLLQEYGIKASAAAAVVWVRQTPLVKHLVADIEAAIGVQDQD
jgi:hypothetical protein